MRVHLLAHIARSAGELAEVYGLRGFDAIHLASALHLRDRVTPVPFVLAASDRRLRDAAERAGLQTFG